MAATNPASTPKDLSKWLTRTQVVDLVQVSIETLRGWEARGLLHPEFSTRHGKTSRPVKVYDPQELADLPQYKRHMGMRAHALDPGERTARAFECLDRGMTIREIVLELRVTVGVAEDLRQQWLDARNDRLTIDDTEGNP